MHTTPKSILIKARGLKTAGAILVILLTAIFFTKTLVEYSEQVRDNFLLTSPLKVLASFLLFVGYLTLRALSWRALVHFLGESINKTSSLSVWFFSEATRYIPGNIWSFASRVYLARLKNISPNASLLVLPLEVATVTTVTALLSSYAIMMNLERLPINFTFYTALIASPIALLGILLLQKPIKRLLRRLFRQDLNLKALLASLVLQIFSWSLYSIGAIVLISNLGQVENLYLLFSSILLAWLVGYLSFVTPMGLGVRESAFVLLTGGQIGIVQAIIIAVLSRVILIIAEFTILAFLAGANKFVQNTVKTKRY